MYAKYARDDAMHQKRLMAESVGMKYITATVDTTAPGDYGCDPLGDGNFRMVPSGDIVDYAERNKRLNAKL